MGKKKKKKSRTHKDRGITALGNGWYRIRARAIDPRTGKEREIQKERECKTKVKARRIRDDWTDEIRSGRHPSVNERLTCGEYARRWAEERAPSLKPRVRDRIADDLELHLLPALGDMYVDAVHKQDILDWRAAEMKRGWRKRLKGGKLGKRRSYSIETANGWLRTAKALFADASADLGIPNPAARIKPLRRPRGAKSRRTTLAENELGSLLKHIRENEPHYYAQALTLGLTGMRWGEATALRWKDIRESDKVVAVVRSQSLKEVDDPKTEMSIRDYPLPDVLASALRDHRRRLVEEQHPGLSLGLVFPTIGRDGKGTYRYPSSWSKALPRWCKAVGIEKHVTPTTFRRAFIDMMRRAKVDNVVRRALVGHAGEAIHEHYSSVDIEEKRQAVGMAVKVVELGSNGNGSNGESNGE